MKKLFFLTFLVTSLFHLKAQDYTWVTRMASTDDDVCKAIIYDSLGSGAVYMTGTYLGTNTLLVGSTLSITGDNAFGSNIFFTKFQASTGNPLWVKGISTTGITEVNDIKIDYDHNLIITGCFGQSIDFGGVVLNASGYTSMFVAKYDVNGNLIWAKKAGGNTTSDRCYGNRISVGTDSNYYIVGDFRGICDFDAITLDENGGSYTAQQIFFTKMDTSGNFIWVEKAGGGISNSGDGICAKNDEVVISGSFKGTAYFGDSVLVNSLNFANYIAKYDTSGTIKWVRKDGTFNSLTISNDVKFDNINDVYFTGNYGPNFYISKWNNSGINLWNNYATGTGSSGLSIYVDKAKDSYVTGRYYNNTDFGAGILPRASTLANNGSDMFIAKYSNTGNLMWTQYGGGADSDDICYAIDLDAQGQIFVAGTYISTSTFGSYTLNAYANLQSEIFVSSINNSASDISILPFETNGYFNPHGYSTGSYCQENIVLEIYSNFNPTSYQWYKDNNPISGATDSSYSVPAGAAGVGTYQVKGIKGAYELMSNPFDIDSVILSYNINVTPDCEANNGTSVLSITNVSGGEPPYHFLIDSLFYSNNGIYTNFIPGTHNVLIVDTNNCTSSQVVTFNFSPIIENNLGNDTIICNRDSISLNVANSNATYLWQDNTTDSVFTITQPGIYWVEVTINTCSITDTITINNNNVAEYQFIDNGNGNYSFTNTSTGNYNQSHWAFGDGTTSTSTNPNHTFNTNGVFIVILTINDSIYGSNCFNYFVDTLSVTGISAAPQCVAGFVMYPDTTPDNVIVINNSIGNNLSYLWDFGDGNTSPLAFPSHTYSTNGPFQLCLTIDDGNGCIDNFCDSIGRNGVVFNKSEGFTVNIVSSPIVTNSESHHNLDSNIEVFPNPTSHSIFIESNQFNYKHIIIKSITGKHLKTFTKRLKNIDISNLSSGIYFIELVGDQGNITKKIIKY